MEKHSLGPREVSERMEEEIQKNSLDSYPDPRRRQVSLSPEGEPSARAYKANIRVDALYVLVLRHDPSRH